MSTILLGNGIGAPYFYSGQALEALIRVENAEDMIGERTFIGHDMYVYSLFAQGLLVFWPIPAIILICLALSGLGFLRSADLPTSDLHATLFLVFTYYFIATFGGNPLVFRGLSMMTGIFMGALIVSTMPSKPRG